MLCNLVSKLVECHILRLMHMTFLILFQCNNLLLRRVQNSIECSSYSFDLELNFKKCRDSDGIKPPFISCNKLSSISNLSHKTALKNQAMQHPQNHKCAHLDMQLRQFTKED